MIRRALFTAITGGYEKLNELPVIARGSMDAFCFTDDHNLTSESWTVVHLESPFPLDPIRSQRSIKILRHEILRDYDETLYIDNSVLLKVDPNQILDDWLSDAEIAMPEHSFRDSVDEEFDAVIDNQLESSDRVWEQRHHYAELYPEALAERPLWNAVIARKNTSTVALFERIWFDHVLRFARRDQLSATVAAKISQVSLRRVPIDNGDSEIHSWPIHNTRKTHLRNAYWPDSSDVKIRLADAESKLEDLKAEAHRVNLALADSELNSENLRLEVVRLVAQLHATWGSPSWKVTRPLRLLGRLVARVNKR